MKIKIDTAVEYVKKYVEDKLKDRVYSIEVSKGYHQLNVYVGDHTHRIEHYSLPIRPTNNTDADRWDDSCDREEFITEFWDLIDKIVEDFPIHKPTPPQKQEIVTSDFQSTQQSDTKDIVQLVSNIVSKHDTTYDKVININHEMLLKTQQATQDMLSQAQQSIMDATRLELVQQHKTELAELNRTIVELRYQLENLNPEDKQKIKSLKQELSTIKQEHNATIKDNSEANKYELRLMKKQHEYAIEDLERAHAREIKLLKEDYEQQIEDLNKQEPEVATVKKGWFK
jgi:hypothetical protein